MIKREVTIESLIKELNEKEARIDKLEGFVEKANALFRQIADINLAQAKVNETEFQAVMLINKQLDFISKRVL